tara:strand:- start:139 stop:381 length:243 start_codon:yes stop_codon:yes gene_type:complete
MNNMKQLPRKMLTEFQKQANSDYWKMCIMNTKEGGTITWKDKGYIYSVNKSKMVAPHKSAYLDLMKNTNKEFFDNYVAKR